MSNELKYFYLLDNNLFRLLCSSKTGQAIINFNKSLNLYPCFEDNKVTAFKMTPFSLLEAIGIVPPKIDNVKLPNEIIQNNKAAEIVDYLFNNALNFYKNNKDVSIENIYQKAAEQKKYVTYEGQEIYDAVVTHVINQEGFIDYIYKQLGLDYLIKYDYPKENTQTMLSFFGAQFFMNNSFSTNISKFRLAKKLWDILFSKIQNTNIVSPEMLEMTRKAMEFKKHKDYLDSELIHFACFGNYHNNMLYQVASCSLDKPEVVVPRISFYKGIIELFRVSIKVSNPMNINLPQIEKKEGLFIFCDNEGSIFKVSPVENIKTMV